MEGSARLIALLLLSVGAFVLVQAGDPEQFYTWNIEYGTISPLGVPQEAILINGQFPGPVINGTTNTVIYINAFNKLDEPFLLTWNGLQHRKNSWQDGTPGTMCPIQPGTNYTFRFQLKDQIGSYFYYPTTGFQRASGAMGHLNIVSRPRIPVPFDPPTDEFNVMIGDWFKKGHKSLARLLDNGRSIGRPDGVVINGKSAQVGDKIEPLFTMVPGNTYRFRMCNTGLKASVNFRIQGHTMKLVELEGSHTVQNLYDSLDIHVGQCMSVLVTADKEVKEYYMVASTRFLKNPLQSVAILSYANAAAGSASSELPLPPPDHKKGIMWSINQFRSFRWNMTASAARPNPQGSYHYGKINVTRTIRLASSKVRVDGKLRYAVNGVSHIDTETPLKLAEYFGIQNQTFQYNLMADEPPADYTSKIIVAPNVINCTFKNHVEIIFENNEKTMQTWNLGGHSFFAVGMGPGKFSPEKREHYNLVDGVYRHNIQVYPNSWSAILTSLDNAGMWNLRSGMAERRYLGEQLYLSLLSPKRSSRDELSIPEGQLLCGAVVGLPLPPPYV